MQLPWLPSPALLPWLRPGHRRVAGCKTCVFLATAVLTHVLTQVPLSEQCLYFVPFFVEKRLVICFSNKICKDSECWQGVSGQALLLPTI